MLPFPRNLTIAACTFAVGLPSTASAIEPVGAPPAATVHRLPVTLSYTPRWQPAEWGVPSRRQPSQPSAFLPTAGEFSLYEALPELDLELDSFEFDPGACGSQRGKPTIGGWIEVGYHSGRLGQ